MHLHPLAEATGVASRADGRESPAGITQSLPQVLQPLAESVHSGEVHEAQKIALLRPVQDVKGIGGVRQQPAVLGSRLIPALYPLHRPGGRQRGESTASSRGNQPSNPVNLARVSLELHCPICRH